MCLRRIQRFLLKTGAIRLKSMPFVWKPLYPARGRRTRLRNGYSTPLVPPIKTRAINDLRRTLFFKPIVVDGG